MQTGYYKQLEFLIWFVILLKSIFIQKRKEEKNCNQLGWSYCFGFFE